MPLLPARRAVFKASFAGFAAFILLGLGAMWRDGLPARFETVPFVAENGYELASRQDGYCFYDLASDPSLIPGPAAMDCTLGQSENQPQRALLFGDSYAGQWEPFWNQIGLHADFSVHAVSTNWCFPSTGTGFTGPKRDRAYQQCLENRRFVESEAAEYDLIMLGGDWAEVDRRGHGAEALAFIEALLSETEAEIIVMPSPPSVYRLSVEQSVHFGRGELIPDPHRQAHADTLRNAFLALAEGEDRLRVPGAEMFFGDYHASGGTLTEEGYPYSLDGNHISIYGALQAADHVLDTRHDWVMTQLLRRLALDSGEAEQASVLRARNPT